MSLTKTRAWIAGTVVLSLLLTVAAWFLLISPNRVETSAVRDETLAVAQKNDETQQRIDQLKVEFAKLQEHQAKLAELQTSLPPDDQLNLVTRELQAAAERTGVYVDAIAPAPPVAADAAAGTGGGVSVAPTVTQPGLVTIPVQVTVTGDYNKSILFLKELQTAIGRDYLVTGIAVGPPTVVADQEHFAEIGWTTTTITGSIFALPESALAAPAPAPAPAPAATPAN